MVDSAIQHLAKIVSVKDKRISVRQHVLTDYTYNLFSIAIDDSNPCSADLLTPEFLVPKIVGGGYQISQKCKWLTWDEIKISPDLTRDAGAIIEAIERYGIDRIPFSFRRLIVK